MLIDVEILMEDRYIHGDNELLSIRHHKMDCRCERSQRILRLRLRYQLRRTMDDVI